MYGWWHSVVVVTLLARTAYTARANSIPKNERCVTAVYTALNYLSFVGEPSDGMWPVRCQNHFAVTSIYAAAETYCAEDERAAGFAQLNTLCRESINVDFLARQNVADNLTEDKIQQMRVVEFQEVDRDDYLGYPVLVSETYWDRTFRTIDTWQTELWAHYAYGYFGYLYWGCIVTVGMLHRLLQHTFQSHYIRAKKSGRLSFGVYKAANRVYQWIYTHFIIAFPLKVSRGKVLWFDLPTRVDAIIIAGYWILSIVLMSITYYLSNDNLYWPEPWRQLLRYIADRTGIMSFANLILIWVFAGRNNIFIWATGWSFAKFNIFHRHVAWIATLQAVVHTVTYLALFVDNGGGRLMKKLSKPYILWGTLATVAMVLMLPFAIDWIRKRSYEFFLLVHITFSVATVVGCFYHVIIFKGQGYESYIWPVVAVWISDRLLRLTRVIYCNLHVRFRKGKIQSTRSIAAYDPASNVVRLEVIPGSTMSEPTASSYYYLYQPFRFRGWESHPFTLGSWVVNDGADQLSSSHLPPRTTEIGDDEEIDHSKMPLLNAPKPQRVNSDIDDDDNDPQGAPERPRLIFWIRPYDGWTRSLRDQCLASPGNTISPTILLEGPYGESFSLGGRESVLLIAGGTGIACAVPYIQENLVHQSTINKDDSENDTEEGYDNDDLKLLSHNKIHLVWAARETAFVRDVTSRELRDALSHGEFEASFYITGKHPTDNSNNHDEDNDKDYPQTLPPTSTSTSSTIATPSSSTSLSPSSSSSSLPNSATLIANTANYARPPPQPPHNDEPLNLHYGRPDIQEIVLQHAQEASETNCSIVIVVSGPTAMAHEARAAVYLAMRKGYRGITFREDSFSW